MSERNDDLFHIEYDIYNLLNRESERINEMTQQGILNNRFENFIYSSVEYYKHHFQLQPNFQAVDWFYVYNYAKFHETLSNSEVVVWKWRFAF